jgi:transcriptional regulator with XRE-family HTH domain
MTLAQVAERAELSLPYISNLERDRGNPTYEALQAVARALETSVGDLTAEAAPATPDAATNTALATAPNSLGAFVRTDAFASTVEKLASQQGVSAGAMRERLIVAMATAPRRSKGQPTDEDWRRLLDVYRLILADDE